MVESDATGGVASSSIVRKLCLLKVTTYKIRLNCRFALQKKKLSDLDVSAWFGVSSVLSWMYFLKRDNYTLHMILAFDHSYYILSASGTYQIKPD